MFYNLEIENLKGGDTESLLSETVDDSNKSIEETEGDNMKDIY